MWPHVHFDWSYRPHKSLKKIVFCRSNCLEWKHDCCRIHTNFIAPWFFLNSVPRLMVRHDIWHMRHFYDKRSIPEIYRVWLRKFPSWTYLTGVQTYINTYTYRHVRLRRHHAAPMHTCRDAFQERITTDFITFKEFFNWANLKCTSLTLEKNVIAHKANIASELLHGTNLWDFRICTLSTTNVSLLILKLIVSDPWSFNIF